MLESDALAALSASDRRNAPTMTAVPTLPIIDISPYTDSCHSSASARNATASAIHDACSRVGFFYLTGHGIPLEEMDEVLEISREFFGRPKEEKEAIGILGEDMARGYQRMGENITLKKLDWHEGLDLYAPSPFPPPSPSASRPFPPLSGTNPWPSQPSAFKPKMTAWIEKMRVLGEAIMKATAEGLGMNEDEVKGLMTLTENSFWMMRCIGYPQLPLTHDGVSCGAHKDYGCYTFLHSDSTKGALQVFLRARDEQGKPTGQGQWINADPMRGAFVINIGEMWEIWTAGLYRATLHRVVHKGENYRVSIPFFYEPNFDAFIEPLPAARRLGATDKKQSVKYGDFLLKKVNANFKVKENGEVEKTGKY